jgi:hypothetical protein
MPENKKNNPNNRIEPFATMAVTSPLGLSMSYAVRKMKDKGLFNLPKNLSAPDFLKSLRN